MFITYRNQLINLHIKSINFHIKSIEWLPFHGNIIEYICTERFKDDFLASMSLTLKVCLVGGDLGVKIAINSKFQVLTKM